MKIPFTSLSDCYKDIYDEIMTRIQYLINTTNFIGGEEVERFEQEFAIYCNMRHAIACSNGTDALILALHCLGIGQGDTVVTVPNTFIATSEAITSVGANVEFVDIDEKTYTMDPISLREYLVKNIVNKRIKAVIPVHIYGQMADMNAIMDIAEEYNLKVIEDAAQAHGAKINGKGPGEYGDIATFSFYPGKNLGAFGDAGAVVANDTNIAKNIKMLSNHGRIEKYKHEIEGYNSRMDSIQAAILRVKLKHLDKWNDLRIRNAKLYSKFLDDYKVIKPFYRDNSKHVYHLYVCRISNRDYVREELKKKGIVTGIHYPIPLHLQPAYAYLGYKKGDFPVTEKVCKEIISLPMWPELKESQIQEVSIELNSLLS